MPSSSYQDPPSGLPTAPHQQPPFRQTIPVEGFDDDEDITPTQLWPEQHYELPPYPQQEGPPPTDAEFENTSHQEPLLSHVDSVGYRPAADMHWDDTHERGHSDPGCCCSTTGGCCCSHRQACCCSDRGGCLCSDRQGCLCSDRQGCLFSDNGGCCCSSKSGCFCSDTIGCFWSCEESTPAGKRIAGTGILR